MKFNKLKKIIFVLIFFNTYVYKIDKLLKYNNYLNTLKIC